MRLPSIFRDKNGKVVIGQKPNLPIIVWFLALLTHRLLPAGTISNLADLISFGALFTWAWLELFSGANTFRRILGGVVLGASLLLRIP